MSREEARDVFAQGEFLGPRCRMREQLGFALGEEARHAANVILRPFVTFGMTVEPIEDGEAAEPYVGKKSFESEIVADGGEFGEGQS